jgi:hypothetical protein
MNTLLLGIAIAIAVVIGLAFLFFSSSSRSGEKRREELESKRMAHQPWDADAADGRANR